MKRETIDLTSLFVFFLQKVEAPKSTTEIVIFDATYNFDILELMEQCRNICSCGCGDVVIAIVRSLSSSN